MKKVNLQEEANESKIHRHGDTSVLYAEPTANPFSGYSAASRATSLDSPAPKIIASPDQKPTTARLKKTSGSKIKSNAKVSGMNYSTSSLAPDV